MHNKTLFRQNEEESDRFYDVIQRCRPKACSWIDDLYSDCRCLLDRNYESAFEADFNARFAELYLISTLRRRLKFDLNRPENNKLDIWIPNQETRIEVIAATNGDPENDNSIPAFPTDEDEVIYATKKAIEVNKAANYDVSNLREYTNDKYVLRLTNAIDTKFKYIFCKIANGILTGKESYIVAVYTQGLRSFGLARGRTHAPPKLESLFPIGGQCITRKGFCRRTPISDDSEII